MRTYQTWPGTSVYSRMSAQPHLWSIMPAIHAMPNGGPTPRTAPASLGRGQRGSRAGCASRVADMQNGAGTSRQSPSLEASRCKGAFLMALMDYIGYAAAVCTTSAYIPQVTRVWRTRSTKDISLKMFLVLIT